MFFYSATKCVLWPQKGRLFTQNGSLMLLFRCFFSPKRGKCILCIGRPFLAFGGRFWPSRRCFGCDSRRFPSFSRFAGKGGIRKIPYMPGIPRLGHAEEKQTPSCGKNFFLGKEKITPSVVKPTGSNNILQISENKFIFTVLTFQTLFFRLPHRCPWAALWYLWFCVESVFRLSNRYCQSLSCLPFSGFLCQFLLW